jgi:hypothetical protein
MDYSLLVGIHDLTRGNIDHIRDNTLSVFQPNAHTLSRRATATTRGLKAAIAKEPSVKEGLTPLGPSQSKLPDSAPPELRYCVFYQDNGGFRSTDANNNPSTAIYYIGVIDILTYYDSGKRFETFFRTLGDFSRSFSAVDPVRYGKRFIAFMAESVLGNEDFDVGIKMAEEIQSIEGEKEIPDPET